MMKYLRVTIILVLLSVSLTAFAETEEPIIVVADNGDTVTFQKVERDISGIPNAEDAHYIKFSEDGKLCALIWQVGLECGSRIEIYDVETKELLTEESGCVSVLFKNDKKGFIIYSDYTNLALGGGPQLNFYNGAGDKIKEYDKGGAGGFALDTGDFYLWHAKYLGNNKVKKMISRFDENGHEVWEKEVDHRVYGFDMTVSRNGDCFAIVVDGNRVIILYNRNGEMLKRIQDANRPGFSPNGEFLAYRNLDKKSSVLIDCNTLNILWEKAFRESIHSMSISQDGKYLYMIQRERRNDPKENQPLLLHKLDAYGNMLWSMNLNNFLEMKNVRYNILTYSDNRMVIVSQSTGWKKFIIMKTH